MAPLCACVLLGCHQILIETDVTNYLSTEIVKVQSELLIGVSESLSTLFSTTEKETVIPSLIGERKTKVTVCFILN